MDFETRCLQRTESLDELCAISESLKKLATKLSQIEGLESVFEEVRSAQAKVDSIWTQLDGTTLRRTVSDWVGVDVPHHYRDFEVAYAVTIEEGADTIRVFPDDRDAGDDSVGLAYSIDSTEAVAEQLLLIGETAIRDFGFSDPSHPIRFEAE